MAHALSIRNLAVGYHGRALLPAFDWDVEPGQFWALLGSNGSGKSTIVKTVLGLLEPVGGDIAYRIDKVGFVPQRNALDLSVPARARDVIEAGSLRGWSFIRPWLGKDMQDRFEHIVEVTDTRELLTQQLVNLSEGQKQRVLIARALMGDARLLVLDEPTSAMDQPSERRTLDLLVRLKAEMDLAIVMVCHNVALVAEYATHALMVDREHQLMLGGDIRKMAYDDECCDHFGLVIRDVVEKRFGMDGPPGEEG